MLEALLLGAAYQLGLVRAAEEAPAAGGWCSSRRWAGTCWPWARRRRRGRRFEHFLFVQPNFEMIAYRQGLTPR